jgi:hypothetical protein
MLTPHHVIETLTRVGVDLSKLPDNYLLQKTKSICCDDWLALLPCIQNQIWCNLDKAGTVVENNDLETTDYSKKLRTLQELATWIEKTCQKDCRGMVHVRVIRPDCNPCCVPSCWSNLL